MFSIIFTVSFVTIIFQPKSHTCQPATVIELKSNIESEGWSFFVSAVTNNSKVVIDKVSPEYFYSLKVGDTVEVCESVGKYIPLTDQQITETGQ
jgi:hypothetical protein